MNSDEKFLCNQPLKPELAQDIWIKINEKKVVKKDEIFNLYILKEKDKEKLELDTKAINFALNLLFTLQLIEPTSEGLQTCKIPSAINTIFLINPTKGFKLLCLNKLRLLSGDPPSYNIQAHFLLTYQILSKQERGLIKTTKNETKIINMINQKWINAGYIPRNIDGSDITFNEPKFVYWRELAVFLGLIYPGPIIKEFAMSMSMELCELFLEYYLNQSNEYIKTGTAPLHELLTLINEKFLYIDIQKSPNYFTIDKPIQGMLLNMESLNKFKFVNSGDSPLYSIPLRRKLKEVRILKKI